MRKRTLLTFLVTILVGLVAWMLSNPATNRLLFGFYAPSPFDYLFGPFSFGLPLALLAAGVAGYASPRLFWLWGIAVVLLRPAVSVLMYVSAARGGAIGPSNYAGLALVEVGFFVAFVVLCTACSAAGAGLRLLVGRLSRRPD